MCWILNQPPCNWISFPLTSSAASGVQINFRTKIENIRQQQPFFSPVPEDKIRESTTVLFSRRRNETVYMHCRPQTERTTCVFVAADSDNGYYSSSIKHWSILDGDFVTKSCPSVHPVLYSFNVKSRLDAVSCNRSHIQELLRQTQNPDCSCGQQFTWCKLLLTNDSHLELKQNLSFLCENCSSLCHPIIRSNFCDVKFPTTKHNFHRKWQQNLCLYRTRQRSPHWRVNWTMPARVSQSSNGLNPSNPNEFAHHKKSHRKWQRNLCLCRTREKSQSVLTEVLTEESIFRKVSMAWIQAIQMKLRTKKSPNHTRQFKHEYANPHKSWQSNRGAVCLSNTNIFHISRWRALLFR